MNEHIISNLGVQYLPISVDEERSQLVQFNVCVPLKGTIFTENECGFGNQSNQRRSRSTQVYLGNHTILESKTICELK